MSNPKTVAEVVDAVGQQAFAVAETRQTHAWQRLVVAAAQLGTALAEYENARDAYVESETNDA